MNRKREAMSGFGPSGHGLLQSMVNISSSLYDLSLPQTQTQTFSISPGHVLAVSTLLLSRIIYFINMLLSALAHSKIGSGKGRKWGPDPVSKMPLDFVKMRGREGGGHASHGRPVPAPNFLKCPPSTQLLWTWTCALQTRQFTASSWSKYPISPSSTGA